MQNRFFFFLKVFRHPISQHTCRLIEGSTLRKALFLCTASSPTWPGAEPWLCQLRLIRSGPGGARGVFEFGLGSLSGINLIVV